jgi:glucose-1-phosphate thymidylyltransferase
MSKTLGIILAGGKSSRLYPATFATTKQVLPIYDKPLIYYPLSALMLAGIRDFIVITTPEEVSVFQTLLWDAEERMGINVEFAIQTHPRGIADAFNVVTDSFDLDLRNIRASSFSRFALILGDNIFYGAGMSELLTEAVESAATTILATKVKDPERFGVVQLDKDGQVLDLEEKPKAPKSDLAITGIYFFNSSVFHRVRKLKPSSRNELEITDLLKTYHKDNALNCIKMPRGSIWFDTGTPDSLLEAANLIQMIQKHQGFMVGNPHEIAYNRGWIDKDALRSTALLCEKSAYGQYLLQLLDS